MKLSFPNLSFGLSPQTDPNLNSRPDRDADALSRFEHPNLAAEFARLIPDLVREAEPDLDTRLEYQAEALREFPCSNPVIGRWIDANDVQYLLAAFALNDNDFAEHFPEMLRVTEAERKRTIETFEEHFEHCPHCSLKRGYDLEMNARIERVCEQKRDQLIHKPEQVDSEAPVDSDHMVKAAAARH